VRPTLTTILPGTRYRSPKKSNNQEKVEAVLGLNVLDPSMGSGHFLVEATEHIARFIVELGVAPEDVEINGEAELAYWKRRVAQSCVYGVDSNPLAVDLAKLSL
jgi:type I restriction-modification system DNA methylase subunit